ncbi:hypothetical protein [Spirillospora sp. NPDC047279]
MLLVWEDNDSAQNAYARWGWKKVRKLWPFPDAPDFGSLVIELPI